LTVGVVAAIGGQLWKVRSRKQPIQSITEPPDVRRIGADIEARFERSMRDATEPDGHGAGR